MTLAIDVQEFDALAWSIAHRTAETMTDPLTAAEDIHSEIVLYWLEHSKTFTRYEGEDRARVLGYAATNVAERVRAAETWAARPDAGRWPVPVIRTALPEIVHREPDWPGTAAAPAWEALSEPEHDAIRTRTCLGLGGMSNADRSRYYRAVETYARALNAAFGMTPACSDHYRYVEHEGPGSQRMLSAAQWSAHTGKEYNG